MNLDGAIHGEWCHTVTYPTRCRYCGRDVFFFTCDHGCRVFFDELGPPWPLHECVGYLRSVVERAQLERYMRQDGRLDLNDLATSSALDAVYGAKVRQNAQRLPSFRTVRVEASGPAEAKGLGVVRQLQPCKDVPKALGAPDCGSLGLAMLGELARGGGIRRRWSRATWRRPTSRATPGWCAPSRPSSWPAKT